MLVTGNLVKIRDTAFKYFAGKLVVVDHIAHREEYYDDDNLLQERSYYLVTISGTTNTHVFPEDDLIVLSKAQNNNG